MIERALFGLGYSALSYYSGKKNREYYFGPILYELGPLLVGRRLRVELQDSWRGSDVSQVMDNFSGSNQGNRHFLNLPSLNCRPSAVQRDACSRRKGVGFFFRFQVCALTLHLCLLSSRMNTLGSYDPL